LNARLFVRGKYKILRTQGLSLPNTLVEIEDRSGLFQKQGIALRRLLATIRPGSSEVVQARNGI
jgi:hypothetical protein